LVRWLSGEEFHALVEQKSSDALHATASLGPLRWGWFELSSPHLDAEGSESGALRQLQADGLRGRLDPASLLGGQLRIEEISLESARLQIDAARPRSLELNPAEVHVKTAAPLPAWLPSHLVIDVIRVKKADVSIQLPSGSSLEILGTHLEAYPEGGATRIEGRGGVVQSPYLPDLDLDTVHCRIEPGLVDLTGADLSFPGGGTLHLDGNFPVVEESTLNGRWENVPLATLIPLLSQQLVGTVEGSGAVSWNPDGVRSLEGTMKAHDVTLSNIPLLEQAAQFTGMDLLRHIPVQQAQATFLAKEGSTEWHDVVLESKGLIKLVGDGKISKEGDIAGSFKLGVSPDIAGRIPGAAQIFSVEVQDGYRWTPFQVGGTLAHPTEDLTSRVTSAVIGGAASALLQGMQQAVGSPAPQGGGGVSGTAPASTSPTGTNTPANPAKAALDILGGFLK
jgi:hypothetical protein